MGTANANDRYKRCYLVETNGRPHGYSNRARIVRDPDCSRWISFAHVAHSLFPFASRFFAFTPTNLSVQRGHSRETFFAASLGTKTCDYELPQTLRFFHSPTQFVNSFRLF